MKWYFEALKKYAVFKGRARRKEFWMFVLCNLIIAVVLGTVEAIVGIAPKPSESVLVGIYQLAILIPSFAVGVRRMHDIDHSGWWSLFPIVNLILAVREGQRGGNRFGPDPKAALPTADDELLTNDAVLGMVAADVGDDVIVNKIRNARCDFRVSSSDFGNLKKQGASDVVLSAMLESQAKRGAVR